MDGSLLVISGPSGCGKSSLLSKILGNESDIYFSISTTTREKRYGEIDGKDYYFITKEEFKKQILEQSFLEWAEVHGNFYGTSIKPIEKALADGKLVIFDVDVQGHDIIKKRYKDIVTSLFITTPSQSILQERLEKRATDSYQIIKNRVKNAKDEMARIDEYDYLLINNDFDETLKKFLCIVEVARLKKSKNKLSEFISTW